jgi:hypothetical protein
MPSRREKCRIAYYGLPGIGEFDGFEYSVTDNGSVRTGAPSGMHDDCVVALALEAWQVRPKPWLNTEIAGPIIVWADGSTNGSW